MDRSNVAMRAVCDKLAREWSPLCQGGLGSLRSIRLCFAFIKASEQFEQISLPRRFSLDRLIIMNILHLVYRQRQREGGWEKERQRRAEEPRRRERKSKGTGVEEQRLGMKSRGKRAAPVEDTVCEEEGTGTRVWQGEARRA